LYDWTAAGVGDLELLRRAVNAGRLRPGMVGRQIVAAVLAMVNGGTATPRLRTAILRVMLACDRADLDAVNAASGRVAATA